MAYPARCASSGRRRASRVLLAGHGLVPRLAWCYDLPTGALLPIAGLIAFYNEKVDIVLHSRRLTRPSTPFS
jgi:uncharacterized protein (DUF427 family)